MEAGSSRFNRGMKKLLIVAGAVAVLLGGFAAFVALQPGDYKVVRSEVLAAAPGAVFPHVNELRKWNDWSPWAEKDPDAKNEFEGPASGVGAVFRWAGNREVGRGSMTIMESRPSEYLRLRLEFVEPFPDACDVEFAFKAEGAGTRVTWTMSGHHGFMSKAVCLFMDLDQMIGGDFEKGLSKLGAVAGKDKPK